MDLNTINLMNKSKLFYSNDHQEILRESRNDTLLSRYTYRKQYLELNYSGIRYSLFGSWSRDMINFDNVLNTDYTHVNMTPIGQNFTLKFQTAIQDWTLQPGIYYSFSRVQDTLFIHQFPTSDISAYNSYFFNLLPETFGDTIPFQNAYDAFQFEILGQNIKDEGGLFFDIKYRHRSNRLSEAHINTGSNVKLQGPRESLCTLNYSSINVKAAWKLNKHSMIRMGLNYNFLPLNWHHTVFPDDPDTLDIVTLAQGNTRSLNSQLGYHLLSKPLNAHFTVAGGMMSNTTHASTPVLGYILRILPISHQGDFDLTSRYIMATSHIDYPLHMNKSTITPRLDLTAARFWSEINLEALLQFGLEDIDLQEQYIHAAYITAIACKADIALNSDLFLNIDIEQVIPYIKTISPVIIPPPPDGIKRYGGLSVSMGVSMTW